MAEAFPAVLETRKCSSWTSCLPGQAISIILMTIGFNPKEKQGIYSPHLDQNEWLFTMNLTIFPLLLRMTRTISDFSLMEKLGRVMSL